MKAFFCVQDVVLPLCSERGNQLLSHAVLRVLLHSNRGFSVSLCTRAAGVIFVLRAWLDSHLHIGKLPKKKKTYLGSCHKRQKPQAPIRDGQTRKVANAKGLNCNTNLTSPDLA